MLGVGAVFAIMSVMIAVVWHFWIGSDIPLIAMANHETAQYWGQLGDFVGGLLNPLLSFAALMAVLYSVKMQRKELALARGEARENYRIQIQQRQNFERQNFEAVFFRLLDIHARLANELTIPVGTNLRFYGTPAEHKGRAAFVEICGRVLMAPSSTEDQCRIVVKQSVEIFKSEYSIHCAHYFRNFYQILKHVHSFGIDPLRMNKKYPFLLVRQLIEQYKFQRIYANMLRAQLESAELGVLFLNCLTANGSGLKYYVERYSMLKHFDMERIFSKPSFGNLFFDPLAFADGEDIDPERLRNHYHAKQIKLEAGSDEEVGKH